MVWNMFGRAVVVLVVVWDLPPPGARPIPRLLGRGWDGLPRCHYYLADTTGWAELQANKNRQGRPAGTFKQTVPSLLPPVE